ncbi:MAG: penicillin-binding protein 2 [Planctomycetota bacterium]|nr:MAG: penicillin-binding protein 2 [Planctomycetota bacterium]
MSALPRERIERWARAAKGFLAWVWGSWRACGRARLDRPRRPARLRAQLVLWCILFGYAGVCYRLYTLQVREHPYWKDVADRQHTRTQTLPPERGRLLFRDGDREVPAAVSVQRGSLLVYGRRGRDVEGFLNKLEEALGPLEPVARERLAARLRAGKATYVRRRGLTPAAVDRVRAARLPHCEVVLEADRVYPFGPLAAQVLGLTRDGLGSTGLERRFEPWLKGVPGRREVRLDVLGRERIDAGDVRRPAIPGYDLVLSIDRSIQAAAEEELARLAAEHAPQGAVAVVVDPRNGDVLAMASWPGYDPNDPGEDFRAGMANRAICHVYEPGSTIKPLLVGTAWELGKGGSERAIHCPTRLKVRGRRKAIVDSHHVGSVREADVIVQSSNTGAYQITARLTPDEIRTALSAFGLGHASGIDLAGEVQGNLRALAELEDPRKLPTTLGSVAQGYALTVTPLQMAMAYAALANGGTLYRPRLVRRLRDRRGRVLKEWDPQPRARPLSARITRGPLREALTRVVNGRHGTARRARSASYTVAGKTGTTKLLVHGRYHEREVVASFAGYAPAEAPRVAFCVVAWAPDTSRRRKWGGTVAAPAAGRIAERALRLLRVPPSPRPAQTK